jgi:hypothetical protein
MRVTFIELLCLALRFYPIAIETRTAIVRELAAASGISARPQPQLLFFTSRDSCYVFRVKHNLPIVTNAFGVTEVGEAVLSTTCIN